MLVPAVTVAGPGRAFAGSSASGILNNAWIITDLGGSVMSNDAQWATLSPGEKSLATTATGTAVATTGLANAPKAGGKLGMVLNTVAVLGGLATLWPGGDDAPVLPMAPGETYTGSDGAYPNRLFCSGWCDIATSVYQATQIRPGVVNRGGVHASYVRWWPRPGYVGCPSAVRSGGLSPGAAWTTANSYTFTNYGQATCVSDILAGADAATAVVVGTAVLYRDGPGANPSTTADPALAPRYIDSTANCRTPGGGLTPLTNRVGPFYFDPAVASTLPEVPDMTCPAGTMLESGTRTLHTEGTSASSDVDLVEPYVAPPWVLDQMIQFPDCYPATTTMCVLKLERQLPLPVVDCHAFVAGTGNPCADWWTDPERSTRYDCSFGGTVVPLKRCKPYADTFSIGVIGESDPEPDGELTDPVPGLDPTPEQTPDLGSCVPNWGLELLNPWWVFKAQACALKWAFVPQPETWGITELKAQMESRPPFSIVLDVSGILTATATAFTSSDGCGLLTDFSSTGKGAIDAPITCADVRDSIPAFSVWYTLAQAALWLGWGIYAWRYLSGLLERGN